MEVKFVYNNIDITKIKSDDNNLHEKQINYNDYEFDENNLNDLPNNQFDYNDFEFDDEYINDFNENIENPIEKPIENKQENKQEKFEQMNPFEIADNLIETKDYDEIRKIVIIDKYMADIIYKKALNLNDKTILSLITMLIKK